MTGNPKLFLSQTGYRLVEAASSGSASVLNPGADINGVLFTGASNIIVTAAAGTLTGNTLNASVINSSLTLLGSSAALPGSPTTTTQAPMTDNTTIATTAYVDLAVASGGFGTLDTVSIVPNDGVTGTSVTTGSNAAITLSLGNITPASIVAAGTISGSNLSGTNTGDQTITLTGDVTGSGTGSFAATIANGVVTGAMLSGTGAVRDFGVTVTNGTSPVNSGVLTATVTVPFTGTLQKWYLSADQSGSIVIDVIRSGSSIIGTGNKPTLSSAQDSNAAMSGWTSVAVTQGDVISFNVISASVLTSCTLVLSLNIT